MRSQFDAKDIFWKCGQRTREPSESLWPKTYGDWPAVDFIEVMLS